MVNFLEFQALINQLCPTQTPDTLQREVHASYELRLHAKTTCVFFSSSCLVLLFRRILSFKTHNNIAKLTKYISIDIFISLLQYVNKLI